MTDPDTEPGRDDAIDLAGPDEDDAEAIYDPDGIETVRLQALGLLSAEDFDPPSRMDVHSVRAAFRDPGPGRLNRDDLTAADILGGSDANDLGIDEEFDTEDDGPEAERLDDRATLRGVPQSDYRRT